MRTVDLDGTTVLVTGGTRGFGKAVGLEFATAGAGVILTHRWGSADLQALHAEFESEGLDAPVVLESDVSDEEATFELMQHIRAQLGRLDVVVSNVAFGQIVSDISGLKRRSLDLSLGYSAWPIVTLARTAKEVFGVYPRYLLAVSSDGSDVCHPGYDLIGACKAVLETLCRYLAMRLKPEGVCVNVVRPGLMDTDSSRRAFGSGLLDAIAEEHGEAFVDPRAAAKTCIALCSGLMDSVTGQVIVVDEGRSLHSPIAHLASERARAPGGSEVSDE